MRVLVLGGGGMLGHKALQVFAQHCEVAGTFRKIPLEVAQSENYRGVKLYEGIDAWDFASVRRSIDTFRPQAILNCIGVIKQLDDARKAKPSIYLNSLFPHLLNEAAQDSGIRLIHVSTDCVFDGHQGNYTECDTPSAIDLYGRTKYLGEVTEGPALTLRTSIIGHELHKSLSLVDWFLSQAGRTVPGYAAAVYTGFPTVVFCRELRRILESFPTLRGLYQISSQPITKYQLLRKIQEIYGVRIEIVPSNLPKIDRSLDSTSYRNATGFRPLSWDAMLSEMHDDYVRMGYMK